MLLCFFFVLTKKVTTLSDKIDVKIKEREKDNNRSISLSYSVLLRGCDVEKEI